MPATGRDGGGYGQSGSSSNSISSSSSGTIVSTTNTTSSSSRLSYGISTESAAFHLDLDLGIHDGESGISLEETGETEKRSMEHIKGLVQEFSGAAATKHSINAGDATSVVLERWFTELGVGWVLHLPLDDDAASAGAGKLTVHTYDAQRSWIQALAEIMESIRCTASLFPDRAKPSTISDDEQEEEEEEEEEEPDDQAGSPILDQFQFARFIQETMLRMLAFVDFMAAQVPNGGIPALEHKISILLRVRAALLPDPLCEMDDFFFSTIPCPQVELIGREMSNLLYAKVAKAGEAIWSTLEEIRTRILALSLNHTSSGSSSLTPQEGSSAIHKVTLSVMGHINFLLDNYSPVSEIVSEAAWLGKYVPQVVGGQPHLDSMIMEMTSALEEKLVNMSESFPDRCLSSLFLLNNYDFIRDRFHSNTWRSSSLQLQVAALLGKVEGYMDRYLQVSWAPLLSSLLNPTPLCLFGKYYYPPALPKFETEFLKMYTAQKLWKVPDPELRTSLRTAIARKIIPGYTNYRGEQY